MGCDKRALYLEMFVFFATLLGEMRIGAYVSED